MWRLHAGRQDKGFDLQLLTEHVHRPVQERDHVTGDGTHSSKGPVESHALQSGAEPGLVSSALEKNSL